MIQGLNHISTHVRQYLHICCIWVCNIDIFSALVEELYIFLGYQDIQATYAPLKWTLMFRVCLCCVDVIILIRAHHSKKKS